LNSNVSRRVGQKVRLDFNIAPAGVLTPMPQMMFGLVLCAEGWTIGSDFFRNRVTVIDYPSEWFIV
jgi:hypothetical protein